MFTTFLTRFLFQIFPVLFYISTAAAQVIVPVRSFGEGIVTIGWYTFPPNDSTARDPSSILSIPNVYSLTYFIKQNKILRRDQADTNSIKDSSVSRIIDSSGGQTTFKFHAEIEHPSYLIDWSERRVYKFQNAPNVLHLEEKQLQEETSEIFYRAMDNNKAVILSQQRNSPIYIANIKCFKGVGIDREKHVFTFFYSEIASKVRSPLNGFLPADFPYNVMRIELMTDPYEAGINCSKPGMIFQVLAIKECRLAQNLFETFTLSK
jgi:hypothetical protein